MRAFPLSYNEVVRQSSRLSRNLTGETTALLYDGAVLILAGFLAASSAHFLDFNLKIPGHAILRTIIPITLGIALVPRRISGSLIGISAYVSTLLIGWTGAEGIGVGATTSMLLAGPILDAALWTSASGKGIVLRCAIAGLLINLVAFAVRGQAKLAGLDSATAKPLKMWFSGALVSYILCGVIAGLICGLLWFRGNVAGENRDRGTAS